MPNISCTSDVAFGFKPSLLNPLATCFALNLPERSAQQVNILDPLAKKFTPKQMQNQNLLPHTGESGANVLCFAVSSMIPLNPLASCFAPNLPERPYEENYFDITIFSPPVLDVQTPNISFNETDRVDQIEHNTGEFGANLETPFPLFFTLDVNANPFIPNGPPVQIGSDKDTSSTILQNIRVKNIDRIIIGHININSIRNKIDLLSDVIRDKIDILLISETKLDNTFPPGQFSLAGYSEPHRLDRTANGGGILLYIRSDIPAKPLPLINKNIECIIVEITVSKKKWLLIGTYNPNKSMITNHLTVLEESLCHYLSHYDNVLALGDFNSEIREEAMDDFCELYQLKSLIKTPTCFKSAENPSCIDLMLTNRPHNFQHSQTIEIGLSDFHLLTVTVLKTSFRKKPPKVVRYRDYKYYSRTKFQNDLNFSLAGIDLNRMSNDEYVALLLGILNKHAPLKVKYIRGNNQPFMTKELRKEHMKRTKLRNKFRKDKNKTNEIAYKKQRNVCVNLLKKVKRNYFENLKPSLICDNKKFWNTVKPLFSEKTMSTDSITLVENNKMITEDKDVADVFNSFFSNAVKNLNIDYYEHFSFDEYFLCNVTENKDPVKKAIEKYANHPSIVKIKETFSTRSTFSFKPIDLEAVIREVANLKESKASPIESIPVKIIKDTIDTTGPKIVIDFNSSINTGDFSQNMKLADVTPLHKKENKQSKLNYRPVSVLSAMSKIFERLMLHQISDYMKDILSIFLCGFRKGMSTQNCLLFLIEKWRKFLDKSKKCGVLLTDLSKAFDCLLHDLFIAKLDAYGFDYLSCKLIYSYLTGRMQRVRVNASFSEWNNIDTGVPQGSVLGPELYNINSNDLFMFLLLDIANFADDNSPFVGAETIPRVISELEQESTRLLNWLKYNGQKANPDKFHLLLSDPNENHFARIENFEIKNTEYRNLLGVTVDNKLTFKNHVEILCTKASQKLHALCRVSKYMTFKQRKTIMQSFIFSQFGYCPLVWLFHSRKLNTRINKIHERALRIVYQDRKSTFKELLEKDESFTVHERNIQTLGIELYKVASGFSPHIMKLVLPLKPKGNFVWEKVFQTFNVKTTSWGLETLAHIGPKIWSIIPI